MYIYLYIYMYGETVSENLIEMLNNGNLKFDCDLNI